MLLIQQGAAAVKRRMPGGKSYECATTLEHLTIKYVVFCQRFCILHDKSAEMFDGKTPTD
jgi:hypothetical protein